MAATDRVAVSFDDEFRIRILDAAKFKATQALREEALAFVASAFACLFVWGTPPPRRGV